MKRPSRWWICQAARGGHTVNLRGAFASGIYATSENYQGPASFNPLSGKGGVTSFVRGGAAGSGSGYSGPYGEAIINYTYGQNGAGPHAATSLSNGITYTYDANGNMTQRVQSGVT